MEKQTRQIKIIKMPLANVMTEFVCEMVNNKIVRMRVKSDLMSNESLVAVAQLESDKSISRQ